MSQILYPIGYSTTLVTMQELRARHEPNMHPEFARRLFGWIESQGGHVGIGGGWRASGSQPNKPGFAPEGKSFHQSQRFPGGDFYAAVDLVCRNGDKSHRSPTWSEVPAQGSGLALFWGVHCNVSSESWHCQPVEIDGYDSWAAAGRPDLKYNYGLYTKELDMKVLTNPTRITDTRNANIPFKAGESRAVKVGNGIGAAFINVTAVKPKAAGYITVWGDGERPNASHLNYNYGENICNGVWVPVDNTGYITVFSLKECHLIIDLLATAS